MILHVGRVEVAVRRRPQRACQACDGRGWFHTKTGIDPRPAPPGYDGVALCGCQAAIDRLSDAARFMRRWNRRAYREPPF